MCGHLTIEDIVSIIALGVIIIGGFTIAILRTRR
jgi:hypothetical protein